MMHCDDERRWQIDDYRDHPHTEDNDFRTVFGRNKLERIHDGTVALPRDCRQCHDTHTYRDILNMHVHDNDNSQL